jgi:23S rRNA pseudouridine1911/1915/1917 synthase
MKSSDREEPSISFCDNHLLIAVKPSGWLTQPDETDRTSLETFAKGWVKQEFQKPGNVFLHCIHRLDRPVSGLVLFARTSKALSRLNELSREGEIRRFYTAEVEGIIAKKEGVLKHYLIHGEHKAIVAKPTHPDAKEALLVYRTLAIKEHTTLLAIELHTGRYHQIRAQFGAIGHPIYGDARYGARTPLDAIHLSCTDLLFAHPVTKELLSFHSDPPFST